MSEQAEKGKLETLQQTVKFFDSLLASLIDCVVITDESHNIIITNEAFCNLLGRRRQEVLETNLFVWLDLLNTSTLPLWTEMTSRLYKEGLCRDIEFQAQTTHGMKYFNVNASLLKSDITGKVCFISVWRDITVHKKAEEELRRIYGELQEKTEYLEKFNKLMVGRELEMRRLKAEVNELLKSLGQPKKYEAPDKIS